MESPASSTDASARHYPSGAGYQPARKGVNRRMGLAALAALSAMLAAACGEAPVPPAGLVLALQSDPHSLDPHLGVDATAARLAALLHIALTPPEAATRPPADLAATVGRRGP